MADAAVESVIEYLHEVQIHQPNLISYAKDLVDIDKLEKDLSLFRSYLVDTPDERRQDGGVRRLHRQIRDVIYEVEDIINATMTEAADANSDGYFRRAFEPAEMLRIICRRVDSICADIRGIYGDDDSTSPSLGDERSRFLPKLQAPPLRRMNVVGIEDEAEKIIGYLTEEAEQLDILSVIGVAGLGKTTLAWKVFGDSAIKYEFPTRIWIYVSGQFTKKDIFLSILKEFMRLSEDVYGKSDVELAKLVAIHLGKRKFLIVMDDVWQPDDWKELRVAFPTSNKMGKVLITTRFERVAIFANPDRSPLKLRFLNTDESWFLFEREVFGACKCPPELKDVGEVIARKCHGLPLAIMVIAGIFVDKSSASDDRWLQVSEILDRYGEKEPLEVLEEVISLSYNTMPYHLRECFLYLAIFPEDYEILVPKLTRMWIAEGFIHQKGSSSSTSLEEISGDYLEDLVKRNLIKADKISRNGRIKTCRVHDKVRDLCKTEASDKDNFLQELNRCGDGGVEPLVQNCSRLCVHSDIVTQEFLSSKPYGPRVRSFVCFSRDEINLPIRNSSAMPAAFKLLRVLEAKPIKFTKLPRNLYRLIHLKYVVISFNISVLPAAFSKFWNMQTLIVNTTSYTLEVKADIWKMTQLRHLKTNAPATLPNSEFNVSEKLQTLGIISPQSCNEEVFNRAPNLKKLSVRGELITLLEGEDASFSSLRKLINLEKLKLLNGVSHSIVRGQLSGLPPASVFPPNLRSLTLSNTFLEWSHISTLGSLRNLEVLKLKDYAFVGKMWEASDGGFCNLEVLHIGCTDLVHWKASSCSFPRLRCLELRNCEELREVPIVLSEIPSLEILDLYRTRAAAASAIRVEEVKRKQAQQSSTANTFELFIFPPHQ